LFVGIFFLFVVFFLRVRVVLFSGAPFIQGVHHSVERFVESFTSIKSLKQENLELRVKISSYEKVKIEFENLQSKLKALQKEQGFVMPDDVHLVVADIIKSNKAFAVGERVVTVGSNELVEKGDLVIDSGSLIGEVVEVYKYTSLVRLITHSESIYSVKLEDGKLANLEGGFDGKTLNLIQIPRDTNASIGSSVRLTPTLLHPHRAPIVLGKIVEFEDIKEEPYLKAKVEPLLDFSYLDTVFIMKFERRDEGTVGMFNK